MKNIKIVEHCGDTTITGKKMEISFRMDNVGDVKAFTMNIISDPNREYNVLGEDEFNEFLLLMSMLSGERLRRTVNEQRIVYGNGK